jgi:phosphoribosylamine---glycine ligase
MRLHRKNSKSQPKKKFNDDLRILLLGSGGREHALAKKFLESKSVAKLFVAPGNDGIAQEATCIDMNIKDPQTIIDFCQKNSISFVFVGPEEPLVLGVADQLREAGINVFGPNADGAQLEGSKDFCKNFSIAAKIPTAKHAVVSSVSECLSVAANFQSPFVLKADGLAAGKGVFICQNLDELTTAARQLFDEKIFGESGKKALLEEFLQGWELSYFVITNGHEYQSLPIAKDHKRLQDFDKGPNTGGMGTIAPVTIKNDLQSKIDDEIVQPTLVELKKRAIDYRGVLFFGIMVVGESPYLLEINCRFGDPETQVILPLINSDFAKFCFDIATGGWEELEFLNNLHSSCVILAAENYPEAPIKGSLIENRDGQPYNFTSGKGDKYWIHAGTKKISSQDLTNNKWVTNGGRVLGALGVGATAKQALDHSYSLAEEVQWKGIQFRKDIGRLKPDSQ